MIRCDSKLNVTHLPVSVDQDRGRPASHTISSGDLVFRILHEREGQSELFPNFVERFSWFATMECHDKRRSSAPMLLQGLQPA